MIGFSLLLGAAAFVAAASWPPEVKVDPRFELLAAVHLVSDPSGELEGFAASDIPYAVQAREFFKDFAKHPAVEGYRNLRRSGYDAVSVQKLMLELGPPPEWAFSRQSSELEREWVAQLRDFARQSRFEKFFRAHRRDYRRWVDGVREEMKGRDYRAWLEEYTGLTTTADYTVILSALRDKSRGNMNHIACPPSGGPRLITSTIGPAEILKGEPVFGFWTRRWDVWHELGHTLFDAELASHPGTVRRSSALYAPIAGNCYGSWDQCLREHLVQGLAFRMLSWASENGRTQEHVWSYEDKKHMPYLGAVIERLREFESERGKYKTLEDFYPRWISAFLDLPGASGAPPEAASSEALAPVKPANSDCLPEGMGTRREPLEPPALAPGKTMGGGELKQRGVWRYTEGDVDAALSDFFAARSLFPRDPELELNLSVALMQKGRLEEALRSAELAVEWSVPADGGPSALAADSLSTRAAILRRLGRESSALQDEEKARLIRPGHEH